MENKKASHVGFILSFIIFVTSAVFIYTILQPSFQAQSGKQNVVDYLKEKIVSRVTSEYKTIGFNSDVSGACLEFENLANLAEINGLFIVKDVSDNVLDSSKNGANLVVESPTSESFFKIVQSNQLNTGNIPECSPTSVSESNYKIGLVRTQEDIFSSKIVDLMEDYETDYTGLKNSFKVPETSDFSILFTYQNQTTISSGSIPEGSINIFSDGESIQYINKEGVKETGTLIVSVW